MTWHSQLANLGRHRCQKSHFGNRLLQILQYDGEKWRIHVKLAILARENITIDALLQPKPTNVRLPVELKYEMAIEDATEDTERDRQIRNSQLKPQWE